MGGVTLLARPNVGGTPGVGATARGAATGKLRLRNAVPHASQEAVAPEGILPTSAKESRRSIETGVMLSMLLKFADAKTKSLRRLHQWSYVAGVKVTSFVEILPVAASDISRRRNRGKTYVG